jgi:hypothetical protein
VGAQTSPTVGAPCNRQINLGLITGHVDLAECCLRVCIGHDALAADLTLSYFPATPVGGGAYGRYDQCCMVNAQW